MVDYLVRTYSKIEDDRLFLKKVKYYSAQRVALRLIANLLVPLYFNISNIFRNVKLSGVNNEGSRIIVSLTTFPARINRVWIVIEIMLRQQLAPDKIILWLSKEQFKGEQILPKKLIKLKKRGLEIFFVDEDLRSHKKYYYSLKRYPNDYILTVDDDLMYPSTLIQELVELNKLFPKTICCDRGLSIISKNNDITPYSEWKLLKKMKFPAYDIFYTSGGGTLFPPHIWHEEVLNRNVFMKYCKFADDVWLNLMSQYNCTKVTKSESNRVLLPIINIKNSTLTSINVGQNLNDRQMEDVRKYYLKKNKIDPLFNLLSTK